MIDEICVSDIALIQEASIQPAPGLTAITGETGAGKTALLQACRLLSGQRADKTFVREGEPEASVSGRFFLADGEGERGSEGASAEDQEIVVSRRLSADGRSRVKIDGQIASVTELSEKIAPLIDLCSQHDQQALVSVSAHRQLLDLFAGEEARALRDAYASAFAEAKGAAEHLAQVQEMRAQSDIRVEEARYILSQIEPLSPSAEDFEELSAFVRRSENAELLARTSTEAYDALCADEGVLDGLNAAIASLEEGARYDGALNEQAESLRNATYLIEDAAREVVRYRDAIDLDLSTLEEAQARLSAYQGLIRRYGPSLEDVIAKGEEAQQTIRLMEDAEGVEAQAQAEVQQAEDRLAEAASALHGAWMDAAPSFAGEINGVLADLEMGSASISCSVEMQPRDQWSAAGADKVELLFRPSATMSERPLAKVASGGELSRVMLAIHVVMGEADATATLIFDEIDAGVGGTVANALAEVLARLARTHQVIVVTHLAQVATRASRHYVVAKSEQDGVASTRIQAVQGDARIHEIARMLSGNASEASLAHARELLETSH